MSRGLARRLRSAIPVVIVFVLVSVSWDLVSSALDPDEGPSTIIAVFIGVLISLPLILLESSTFAERTRVLPFWAAVLLKTVTYVGALTAIFLGTSFVIGGLQGRQLAEFGESLPQQGAAIAAAFTLYLVLIFVRQLDSLLGPGVLVRYLTGAYHRPRRERRVFMFVDIRGSTALSERLSLESYYGLVNDFFRDVSGPVLDTRGEIYEYVGDEVVITWKHEAGISRANCIQAFFEIEKRLWENSDRYLKRYGVVPEFKAGLHSGEVIAAEMGDLKKEIAFNGEVLNVAARIQGECNALGRRLLASKRLVDELGTTPDLTAEPMGSIALRGTAEATEIVAFA